MNIAGQFHGHMRDQAAADQVVLKQLGHGECVSIIADLTRERNQARESANACAVHLSRVSRELGLVEAELDGLRREADRLRSVIADAYSASTHKRQAAVITAEVESWTKPAAEGTPC